MSHSDYVDGFGVVGSKGLNIRTISDTRRAAIVNWLCTDGGVLVTNYTSDEEIETLWERRRGDVMVMPVRCYVQ